MDCYGSLAVNPSPGGTGILGADNWNSSTNIGFVYSSATDTALRSFRRGGSYDISIHGGILTVGIHDTSDFTGNSIGFRVSR
jgi:hypothetical protein